MKVLVATSETQGQRPNDFCWTVEGELVAFPAIECDCGDIDGECGCHRAMAGVATHRATTTVKVVERSDLSPSLYGQLITDGYKSQGYVSDELLIDPEVKKWLGRQVNELINMAELLPLGVVIERRGDAVAVRRCATPD